HQDRAIFLIGDPKQSIYGFRGADIYSYIQVRARTAGQHNALGINYRSTTAVVSAINALFGPAELRGKGAFYLRPDPSAQTPVPFIAVQAQGRSETLICEGQAVPALTLAYTPTFDNKTALMRCVSAACAEQLVHWLNSCNSGFHTVTGEHTPLRPRDMVILVHDRHEASAVRQALTERGIRSVYLSDKESVFASPEAKDLLRCLQAAAYPHNGRLVRAAMATSLMAQSLDEMLALAHDDHTFENHMELWLSLHHRWQRHGILPMIHQALHHLKLPGRWLAQEQGERRLTNVLHLAELLQQASAHLEGHAALIHWLNQAITENPDDEGQILRLESEDDLVKVITIHKAKGLEFPVVFLPFATMVRNTTGPAPIDPTQHPDPARLQEDLRLLYVALTRAQHALWVGLSPLKNKKNEPDLLWKSALGYLLGATPELGGEALPRLLQQHFAGVHSLPLTEVCLIPLNTSLPTTPLTSVTVPAPLRELPDYTASFERDWTISSFSALVRDIPRQNTSRDEAFFPSFTPEPTLQSAARHLFPRGSYAGKFLHDQLHWLAEQGFALRTNPLLPARLQQRCERQGWGQWATVVETWLKEIVTTSLPPLGASLEQLTQFLPEMEFWFPVHAVDCTALDRLCQTWILPSLPRPPLTPRTLKGLIMGFADLVFEWQGKLWVLDYKSNYLGKVDEDYSQEALEKTLVAHRYELQGALYLTALSRLAARRHSPPLPLGGSIHLFLRGIQSSTGGCIVLPAEPTWLVQMEAALGLAPMDSLWSEDRP
ncbi:MAG: ATP-binding domain-containing protein, partial [Ferrovum sp.]|nr:ATP-binding domain-containing protein [Ferrovum sp.]